MFNTFLVPEKTVVTAKGDSQSVEISSAQNKVFLLLLRITNAVEQESIDVTVWGSSDGQTWSPKPIASFPQKFYLDEQPLLLDLTAQTEIKFLRLHWELNRWGRGSQTPMFEFSVNISEVPPELLR